MMDYKSPFPYFGGKSSIASQVWAALGNVPNYVEPFFGSGAVFFMRPTEHKIATLNDADGFVANFFRAMQADADAVAQWADWPVSECDLHARHAWLVGQAADLQAHLEGNPDYYDAKIAGWWCWGMCCWIGSGFCSGSGPWIVEDGKLVDSRQLPHLGDAGTGIKRKRPHLGNAGRGIARKLPHLGNAGTGINRQRPQLMYGTGINRQRTESLTDYFCGIRDMLAGARICCGDWERVCGPSPTFQHGMTGVFLDPPYSHAANREAALYRVDCEQVAHRVRQWCLANGANPLMRIVVAGYEMEHAVLRDHGWRVVPWKARGGYGSQGDEQGRINSHNERLFLSPYCLRDGVAYETSDMFAAT